MPFTSALQHLRISVKFYFPSWKGGCAPQRSIRRSSGSVAQQSVPPHSRKGEREEAQVGEPQLWVLTIREVCATAALDVMN